MPLQNRVDPFGAIHATPERGLFTGNRGIIHDPASRTLLKKRWSTRAWIICVCEFRGRRRVPMAGRNWTELFFLDEVTALAAGHRPCFYCRRADAKAFADAYSRAFGIAEPRAPEIDLRLHGERLASGGKARPLDADDLAQLPDGAMVATGDRAFALAGGSALPWHFSGYGAPMAAASLAGASPRLVTPPATVAVLRAGYLPIWHNSKAADASSR